MLGRAGAAAIRLSWVVVLPPEGTRSSRSGGGEPSGRRLHRRAPHGDARGESTRVRLCRPCRRYALWRTSGSSPCSTRQHGPVASQVSGALAFPGRIRRRGLRPQWARGSGNSSTFFTGRLRRTTAVDWVLARGRRLTTDGRRRRRRRCARREEEQPREERTHGCDRNTIPPKLQGRSGCCLDPARHRADDRGRARGE